MLLSWVLYHGTTYLLYIGQAQLLFRFYRPGYTLILLKGCTWNRAGGLLRRQLNKKMSDDDTFGTHMIYPSSRMRRRNHIYVLKDERQVNGMEALIQTAKAQLAMTPVVHFHITCLAERPGFVERFMREVFPLFRDVSSIEISECTIHTTDVFDLARALWNHPRPIDVFELQRSSCCLITDMPFRRLSPPFIRALRLNPRLHYKRAVWWLYTYKQNNYPHLYAHATAAPPTMLDLLDLVEMLMQSSRT